MFNVSSTDAQMSNLSMISDFMHDIHGKNNNILGIVSAKYDNKLLGSTVQLESNIYNHCYMAIVSHCRRT